MRLKNRFKNRFESHQKWIEWFRPKDFRSSVICTLARFERVKNHKILSNEKFIIKNIRPDTNSTHLQVSE